MTTKTDSTTTEPNNNATPEWVTSGTHEHSYELEEFSCDSAIESIPMSPEEYIELKRHLAKIRGYEVDAEAEADPTTDQQASEPQPAWLSGSSSGKMVNFYWDDIERRVVRMIRDAAENSDHTEERRAQILAEMSLLNRIVMDWDSGCCEGLYPDELPLVAAIRDNAQV